MIRELSGLKKENGEWAGMAEVWEGVRDCIPTLLGYLSIGFAAGVVEKTAGLSMAEIVLMSVFLYAGSAQFIAAGMIAAGSPALSIIFTVFLVNIRHLLLSAALSPYFRSYSPWKNLLLGSQLTDETFAVAVNRLNGKPKGSAGWMLGLNMTAHLNWIAANLAGALLGAWITEPGKLGLDYALPAMFAGLLVLQLMSRKKWFADLTVTASAVAAAAGACYLFPANMSAILAIVFAACIGTVTDRWK